MIKKHSKYFFSIIIILLCLIACSTVKKVNFETPVDTTTKSIEYQVKRDFEVKELGVFASNKFDGARLNNFKIENDSTVLIVIKPENQPINNSAYYAFKTWSNISRTCYFKFQYSKGYKHRYLPKIKSKGNWMVLDKANVIKNDSVTIIKLNLSIEPIIVAAQEIETSSDVENWYINLKKGKEDYIREKVIGKSILGRKIPVLDIYRGDSFEKDIVVLFTRQHPPEVTGYNAFKEFLKAIVDDSEQSNLFLNKYRVLAFPILNPDGVDLGHWRHNAGGVDTNRDWSVYNQPEVKQVVSYINKTLKIDKCKIMLGLDFHSTYEDVFYTNKLREKTTMPNFIDDWFTALEKNIPNYKVNEAAGNSTKPVSKGWFLYGHNAVGITYEIGDATPKEKIELIGKISAEQMMNILLEIN